MIRFLVHQKVHKSKKHISYILSYILLPFTPSKKFVRNGMTFWFIEYINVFYLCLIRFLRKQTIGLEKQKHEF